MNRFLASTDPERRAAHREEKKRALAKIEVQRETLAGLQSILAKLNRDSDLAAESHQTDAGKLQSELDELDARQIDCVMSGKATPSKDVARRGQILEELSALNTALELRCEANRRAAIPIQKQIQELQIEIGRGQAIQNQLVDLASVEVRRQRLFNDLKQRAAVALANEIRRRLGIAERNVSVSKANKNSQDVTIHAAQAADYQWMLTQVGAESAALRAADDMLIQQALSE